MFKDTYFINYYPDMLPSNKNITVFEFNNVIIKFPNKLGKDIYNIIDHNLNYYFDKGKLRIHDDDKFKSMRLFVEDFTILEKYTLSNTLEVKDDYMLLHCGNVALKIDNYIYDSDLFYYIGMHRSYSCEENAYDIYIPKDKEDHFYESGYIIVDVGNDNIIDFSDFKWFSKHTVHVDNRFMNLYNELILGRI